MSTTARPTADEDDGDRAVRLFAAERILEQFAERKAASAERDPIASIGLAELVRFLEGDPGVSSALMNRAMLQRPALRADLTALRIRLTRMELPAVAAASDGDLEERPLPGGRLSLFAPSDEALVYLSLALADSPPPGVGLSLVLTTEENQVLVLPLPEFNDEGTVTLILTIGDAGDAALVAALRNPRTRGDFIERTGPRDD